MDIIQKLEYVCHVLMLLVAVCCVIQLISVKDVIVLINGKYQIKGIVGV